MQPVLAQCSLGKVSCQLEISVGMGKLWSSNWVGEVAVNFLLLREKRVTREVDSWQTNLLSPVPISSLPTPPSPPVPSFPLFSLLPQPPRGGRRGQSRRWEITEEVGWLLACALTLTSFVTLDKSLNLCLSTSIASFFFQQICIKCQMKCSYFIGDMRS